MNASAPSAGASSDRITRAVFRAIDQVNAGRDPARRVEKAASEALVGAESVLDSLGIVNLIIAVEEAVEEEFGVAVNIADERARLQPDSPVRTVGSLIEYIGTLLKGTTHG